MIRHSPLGRSAKRRLDILLNGAGRGLGRVSFQGAAGAIDQELREVPLDALRSQEARL